MESFIPLLGSSSPVAWSLLRSRIFDMVQMQEKFGSSTTVDPIEIVTNSPFDFNETSKPLSEYSGICPIVRTAKIAHTHKIVRVLCDRLPFTVAEDDISFKARIYFPRYSMASVAAIYPESIHRP